MDDKKELFRKVINVFETDTVKTKYDVIYIYKDGPNKSRQITLSWGLTANGNLNKFINNYIVRDAKYSKDFKPYANKAASLTDSVPYKQLLIAAAQEDPVFREEMDKMFDVAYWDRAAVFFETNGFKTPLAFLVILDSMIHSGSILPFLRKKFTTHVPVADGDEKEWIRNYLTVRRKWLAGHSNAILRGTTYRADFLLGRIAANDWAMKEPGYKVHGVSFTS